MPESPLPASSLNPKQLQARGSGLEKATPPPHDPSQVIFGEMSFERNSSKKDPVVSGARLWRRPWALSGGGDAASCVWPGESGPEGAGTAAHTGRRGVAVAERLGGTGPGRPCRKNRAQARSTARRRLGPQACGDGRAGCPGVREGPFCSRWWSAPLRVESLASRVRPAVIPLKGQRGFAGGPVLYSGRRFWMPGKGSGGVGELLRLR